MICSIIAPVVTLLSSDVRESVTLGVGYARVMASIRVLLSASNAVLWEGLH